MAASDPISALTALGGAPATGDLLVTVDVSDSTQSANGTTKKMTVANLFASPTISSPTISSPTITSPTISGATISTSTLASPTITGTATAAAISASGAVSAASVATTGAADIGGAVTSSGVVSSGGVTSSAATGPGIGYATGAGGAVTQATSRSTGVTLNTLTGTITTNASPMGGASSATFTVTNSTVAVGDTVVLTRRSIGTTSGFTVVFVSAIANGSFNITTTNLASATSETAAFVINFAVIKAVSA